MSDIELVIKIPEDTYRRIKGLVSCDYFEHDICGYCMGRIADGIPLPKGHGRLIDVDAIITKATKEMKYPLNHGYMECVIAHMNLAPTIIEADEGE